MKKLYFLSLILCMILLGTKTNAQPIPVFAYQGIAVNADGQRLSNQSITLRFSVMYGSITGTLVYGAGKVFFQQIEDLTGLPDSGGSKIQPDFWLH